MAYTRGYWKLNEHTWPRLMNWLEPFLSQGELYLPIPHPRLEKKLSLEIQGITTVEAVKELAGMRFILRGLFFYEDSLYICCFPQTEIEVLKLQRLTGKQNTMFYSKLFQGKAADVAVLRDSIAKWSECVFGELWPYKWTLRGTGATGASAGVNASGGSEAKDTEYWTPLIVAHRGLTNGPNTSIENDPNNALQRSSMGLYTEIDVWFTGKRWFLGHDSPDTEIDIFAFFTPYIFFHAKTADTFHELQQVSDSFALGLRVFYHTDEDYVLTTRGETIIYPGLPEKANWLYMMPERDGRTLDKCAMICSDFS